MDRIDEVEAAVPSSWWGGEEAAVVVVVGWLVDPIWYAAFLRRVWRLERDKIVHKYMPNIESERGRAIFAGPARLSPQLRYHQHSSPYAAIPPPTVGCYRIHHHEEVVVRRHHHQ